MNAATRVALKVTSLTTVGVCGWYLGKCSEQKIHLNIEKDSRKSIFSNVNFKSMPGLPLFATVSAATAFVPTDNETDMGSKLSAEESLKL